MNTTSRDAASSSAPKFTPGPYEVIETDFPNENDIVSYATEPGIAVAQHVSDQNGPLFAAAPDLYHALSELLVIAGTPITGKQEEVFHRARRALARARGRQ